MKGKREERRGGEKEENKVKCFNGKNNGIDWPI